MDWITRLEAACNGEARQDIVETLKLVGLALFIIMIVGFAIMVLCELTSSPS